MSEEILSTTLQSAIAHHQAGRLPQAEALYREVLARDPGCADALHLLGVISLQEGRGEVAVDLIRRAIVLSPMSADFHGNLGEAYRRLSRLDEAVASLRRAVALRPEFPVALNGLGVVLAAQCQTDEAVSCYQQALHIEPNYADALHNLGNIFAGRGEQEEAQACFQRVLAVRPQSAETLSCLGNSLVTQNRLEEAIAAYRQALALQPAFAEAHSNLGRAYAERNQLDDAFASIQRAIAINPELAAAHYNLGNVLVKQGRLDEAVISFRRAIALKPDYVEAYNNLGGAFKERGQLDEALGCFRKAIALDPNDDGAHSNLILTLVHQVGDEPGLIEIELRRWNQQRAVPLASSIVPHARNGSPDRRLRIGYLSKDFRLHSVAYFLLPLLEAHDREKFHVICYSIDPRSDSVTVRLQACADEWRKVARASDEDLARRIREDQIDLLVDLSGHTAGNRLLVLARKPAPLQVSYLGFPAATGLDTIDYRLTDCLADPPNTSLGETSEQLVRLPETAWCYTPLSGNPSVGPLPAKRHGYLTFGCFNNFAKVTEDMLRLWVRILQQVPGSRLALKNPAVGNASVIQRLQAFFTQHGINAARLELIPRVPLPIDHLQSYDRVDLALDTFPYHGTTTTCESLWMGVPVVTLAGPTHVSRVGVSLLTNVGLPECVTQNPEAYVETAVALARDLPRLAGLRASLRERMRTSPLMDAPRFARHVEAAYRTMWQKRTTQP